MISLQILAIHQKQDCLRPIVILFICFIKLYLLLFLKIQKLCKNLKVKSQNAVNFFSSILPLIHCFIRSCFTFKFNIVNMNFSLSMGTCGEKSGPDLVKWDLLSHPVSKSGLESKYYWLNYWCK